MELTKFKKLIQEMPVACQAFVPSERAEIWKDVPSLPGPAGQALSQLFKAYPTKTLSRSDLFKLGKSGQLDQFVIATLVWGYPTGGRGDNIKILLKNFNVLKSLINQVRNGKAPTHWDSHLDWFKAYKDKNKLEKIGISTYTKFLYFMGTKINKRGALILDLQVAKVIASGKFDELASLSKLKPYPGNMEKNYARYLEEMWKVSRKINIDAGNLEMFLFTFGSVLKEG